MVKKKLILIVGPTASGKTDYSISLAEKYSCPIISCDSRQIYKELKIGTAPPDKEQLKRVKHYFIFSHSVISHYTAGLYEVEALELINELFKTYDTLVAVGGSGLYADALCYGIDDFPPADLELRESIMEKLSKEGIESLRGELKLLDRESYDSIDIANSQRVVRALEVTLQTGRKFSSFKKDCAKQRPFIIEKRLLERPRAELYERIDRRVDKMMKDGLLDEVRGLLPFKHLSALKTVGYRELFDYLDGKIALKEAVDLIKRNSRRYAKRQMTWWRRDKDVTSHVDIIKEANL
ncbi:MAG: hypothetical protein ACD_77C00438G0012 [uncultured bacterium]|nr:MAG: hypothetical protein ACD_77C00438G0012 [uncultured bacterium]HBY01798.1 tRNA (adenosine(37)-N6)-dimethylallyltransferase MiaA [Rikenellaceae bacterium]